MPRMMTSAPTTPDDPHASPDPADPRSRLFFDPLALARYEVIAKHAPSDMSRASRAVLDEALCDYPRESDGKLDRDAGDLLYRLLWRRADADNPAGGRFDMKRFGFPWISNLLLAFERRRAAVLGNPILFLCTRFGLCVTNPGIEDMAFYVEAAAITLRSSSMLGALPLIFTDPVLCERINSVGRVALVRGAARAEPARVQLFAALRAALADTSPVVRLAALDELGRQKLDPLMVEAIRQRISVESHHDVLHELFNVLTLQPHELTAEKVGDLGEVAVDSAPLLTAPSGEPTSKLPMIFNVDRTCECGFDWRLAVDFRAPMKTGPEAEGAILYAATLQFNGAPVTTKGTDKSAVVWVGEPLDGVLAVRLEDLSAPVTHMLARLMTAYMHVRASTAMQCLELLAEPEAVERGLNVNVAGEKTGVGALHVEGAMLRLIGAGLAHRAGVGLYRAGPSPARKVLDWIEQRAPSGKTSPMYQAIGGLAESEGAIAVSAPEEQTMLEFTAALAMAWLHGCGAPMRSVFIVMPLVERELFKMIVEAAVATYFPMAPSAHPQAWIIDARSDERLTWTWEDASYELTLVASDRAFITGDGSAERMIERSKSTDLWCTIEREPIVSSVVDLLERNSSCLGIALARVGREVKSARMVKHYVINRKPEA
jgi:hypothetical protein